MILRFESDLSIDSCSNGQLQQWPRQTTCPPPHPHPPPFHLVLGKELLVLGLCLPLESLHGVHQLSLKGAREGHGWRQAGRQAADEVRGEYCSSGTPVVGVLVSI